VSTRRLGIGGPEVSGAEEREGEVGFGSRPQLIGTGSAGLVSSGLNLAGRAK